jgi:hypothetical protein
VAARRDRRRLTRDSAAGALLIEVAPLTAPVLQLGCLVAVLVVALVATRRRS